MVGLVHDLANTRDFEVVVKAKVQRQSIKSSGEKMGDEAEPPYICIALYM